MRPVLFIFAALALAGCTPMQWVRDGAVPAPEVLEQDASTCRREAWHEAQYRSWAYNRPFAPTIRRDSFGRSFVAWPNSAYPYPFGDPFFEEVRLADFCMRAKGYELVPVEASKAR